MIFKLFFLFIFFVMNSFAKNIYVVYDDSGSMKKESRWVYANYAMQNLVSILGEKDKLTLIKMSDYKNDFKNSKEIKNENLEEELSTIQNQLKYSSQKTPYGAVVYAIETMTSKLTKEETNWLIIITDGEFEDGESLGNFKMEEIKKKIGILMEKTSTKPIFFIIGTTEDELVKIKNQEGITIWKSVLGEGEYPKIVSSLGKEDIIDKIMSIAYLVTSKSSEKLKIEHTKKDNKIEFNTIFPLKRVIVLETLAKDREYNKIIEIKNEKKINYERGLFSKINYKGLELIGIVTPLTTQDGSSITGKTIIEFEKNVNNDIKLLYEVNAKFIIELFDEKNNKINNNFIEEEEGKKIKIKAKLMNDTKEEKLEYYPETKVKIMYGKNIYILEYNPEKKIYEGELEVILGKKNIGASAEYPGYFDLQTNIYTVVGIEPSCPIGMSEQDCDCLLDSSKCIEPIKPRIIEMEIRPELNSKIFKQSDFELEKFIFIPMVDKNFVYTKDLKSLNMKFETNLDGELVLKKNELDHISWEFIPKSYTGIDRFKNPRGNYKYSATLTGNLEDEKFTAHGEIKIIMGGFFKVWGALILSFIVPIFIAIIILGYIIKKRFSSKAEIVIEKTTESYKYPTIKTKIKSFIMYKIIPFLSEKTIINDGIEFIADGKNVVKVKGKNIKKLFSGQNIKTLYIKREKIDIKSSTFGKKDYRLFNGDYIEIQYKNDGLIKKYTYFYKSENRGIKK